MAQEYANLVQALCSVTASQAGAGVTPTYGSNAGFTVAAGAHTVAGQYDLVLDTPLDPSNSNVHVTAKTATADATVHYSRPDASTIRVNAEVAGVASDIISFDVVANRMPNS